MTESSLYYISLINSHGEIRWLAAHGALRIRKTDAFLLTDSELDNYLRYYNAHNNNDWEICSKEYVRELNENK